VLDIVVCAKQVYTENGLCGPCIVYPQHNCMTQRYGSPAVAIRYLCYSTVCA